MALRSRSYVTEARSSGDTGRELGGQIRADLGREVSVVLAYLTVDHDQRAFLRGLRSTLGDVPVVGCSGQGVIGRGCVREVGHAASLLALGGDSLACATAAVDAIAEDTRGKGRALGAALRARCPAPAYVVLHHDPVVGADIDELLAGLHAELPCPVIGAGAAHGVGVPIGRTFQYAGGEVRTGAAVAVALGGTARFDAASSLGCSPTGAEMVVTCADGNRLLELDGRPALEVWQDIAGVAPERFAPESAAALALGVRSPDGPLIRAAVGLDLARGGLVLQAGIATGTRVALYQRTTADVLDGTRAAVRALAARLAGARVRAVLGFESGARTTPFLGADGTLAENLELQQALAPDADYAGVIGWGELFPFGGSSALHHDTYSFLVITD
jgi:hypothetical protein